MRSCQLEVSANTDCVCCVLSSFIEDWEAQVALMVVYIKGAVV